MNSIIEEFWNSQNNKVYWNDHAAFYYPDDGGIIYVAMTYKSYKNYNLVWKKDDTNSNLSSCKDDDWVHFINSNVWTESEMLKIVNLKSFI